MDLNKAINESLQAVIENGTVKSIIEKRIEKTIEDIVDESLRSYSDFGKGLKKEIQSALNIDLSNLNISSYNVMILNTVRETMDRLLHENGVKAIQDGVEKLLTDSQKEYKLSELIEQMKEEQQEDGSCDYEGDECTVIIDSDRRVLTFIYFDPEPQKEKYQCRYRIWCDENGVVKGADIDQRKFDNRLIMGGLRGFEKTLFRLYASNAKLIVDENDIDTYYPCND